MRLCARSPLKVDTTETTNPNLRLVRLLLGSHEKGCSFNYHVMLGLRWGCTSTEVALGVRFGCAGAVLVLCWGCAMVALGLCLGCAWIVLSLNYYSNDSHGFRTGHAPNPPFLI